MRYSVSRRDHVLAALGFIVGALTITFAVVVLVLFAAPAAHAEQPPSGPFCNPNDPIPCTLGNTGTDAYLAQLLTTAALSLVAVGILLAALNALRNWWADR